MRASCLSGFRNGWCCAAGLGGPSEDIRFGPRPAPKSRRSSAGQSAAGSARRNVRGRRMKTFFNRAVGGGLLFAIAALLLAADAMAAGVLTGMSGEVRLMIDER